MTDLRPVCLWLLLPALCVAGPKEDFFESSVRPVLVERCFSCHSQAAKKSKGGLLLDSREAVLKGGNTGPAIVSGNPADSLLIRAVKRTDADYAMPPTGDPLTPVQIRHLESWIADGAVFPGGASSTKPDPAKHWAFQPIRPALPPTPKGKASTEIDRFLIAAIEAKGLTPAGPAPLSAVARRLSFALTGLPPSLEDLKTLTEAEKMDRPAAIRAYADRLLGTTAYGERFARHWLDLVRYADSAGHEYDYEFEGAWQYRDYLVRAFRDDLKFDQLVREQVAGDLMPPRVVDGRNERAIATAWWNLGEAAAAPVDIANDEGDRMDNRLDVLAKTFTGLTLGCARCHDHKFDPIPTRDYYAMFGIAASTPADRVYANLPALRASADRLKSLRDKLDALRVPAKGIELPTFEPFAASDKYRVVYDVARADNPGVSVTGFAELVDAKTSMTRGVTPALWTGLLSRNLPSRVRTPSFTIARDSIDVLVSGEDSTVQVILDNLQIVRGPIYDGLKKPIGGKKGFHWVTIQVGRWKGQRAYVEVMTGKVDNEYRILHTNPTPNSHFGLRAIVESDNAPPAIPAAKSHERGKLPDSAKDLLAEYAKLEKAVPATERVLGVSDLPGEDRAVAIRGNAGNPRPETVPRRGLTIWGGNGDGFAAGSGRVALADRLVAHDNPLTARVIVNRLWHWVYGRGLVATVDNFGILGEAPSHPELLDYLADRFVKVHRWSVKAMLRELVLTDAFVRASGPAPTADASNVFLSVHPLRRLDAESVRDTILAVTGRLDAQVGGESIPIPHRLAQSGSDSGNNIPPSGPVDGRRRRSLYLASFRNLPSPFLDVFDKPTTLSTFGRRDVTTVPAQALTLLNDPFCVQMAEAWAKTLRDDPRPVPDRIREMYLKAYAREPLPAEVKRAEGIVAADRERGWDDLTTILLNTRELIHVP